MADNQKNQTKKIVIKIRNANRIEEVTVDDDITIVALSNIVRPIFDAPSEPLRFIFAGKVMKENETLKDHNVKDGFVVHLVIKRRAANERANTEDNASGSEQSSGSSLFSDPFFMTGVMSSLENPEGARNLLGNFRELFNIPIFDNLLTNPENIRSVIMSNPQIQELIDRQPEIAHLFNNPDMFRQTIEIIGNPSMMQEMIRSQDRALSNLESIPGGYNALERMYRDIQEPMLNAATNPFGLFQNDQRSRTPQSSANQQQGRENRDPLPNPWATNRQDNNAFSPLFNTAGIRVLDDSGSLPTILTYDEFQRMASMVMSQSVVGTTTSSVSGTTTVTTTSATATTPTTSAATITAPISATGAQFLAADERDNIEVAETGAANAKAAAARAEASSIVEIAAAAAARASLAAAGAGMAAARAGLAAVNSGNFADAALAAGHAAEAGEAAARAGRAAAAAAATASENAATIRNQEAIVTEETIQPVVSNEEKYQAELTKLYEMGFTDRESNLRALIESNGNVSVAVGRLLSLDPLNFE